MCRVLPLATCDCTIIVYMTTLSVAAARANFSRLVDSATTTHERFEVTRNGSRAAVLMGADDYDSLIETLDILGSTVEMEAIRQGSAALAAGETFTVEQVRQAINDRTSAPLITP
jgi:antitoxin YefM